ncbi:hypothetical protein ES703_116823 [subsurface metagenome]
MALTTVVKVKALGFEPEHFNLTTAEELSTLIAGPLINGEETRIGGCVAEAAKRLKVWMGAAAYTDAEQESPSDPTRAAAMVDAETFLTAVELVKIQRQRALALVGSFKADNVSSGISEGNLRAFDTQEDYWLAQASRVLRPWLSGGAGFASKEEEL